MSIRIREIREAQKMTIAELAERVGVSAPHISDVERGKKNLNNHLLIRIAKALDVLPEQLILSGDQPSLTHIYEVMRKMSEADQLRVAQFAEALLLSSKEDTQN